MRGGREAGGVMVVVIEHIKLVETWLAWRRVRLERRVPR